MPEPLPFEDYNVALAGPPEFVDLVEKRCWLIGGVETFRILRVHERTLEQIEPDLVVLCGYMDRVPDDLLELYTVIGFHPSLLPAYRGGSALKWQLRAEESVDPDKRPAWGVSVYRLTPGRMDAGPIVVQQPLRRPLRPDERRPGPAYRLLREMGVLALSAAVAAYARGTYTETPQDESLASWHPLLRPGQSPTEYLYAHQATRQGAA